MTSKGFAVRTQIAMSTKSGANGLGQIPAAGINGRRREPIPHSLPTIGEDEIAAATACFSSGKIADGPAVAGFENEVAGFLGRAQGVATNCGTSALHLALLTIGVGRGDEVLLPTYTCPALLNAVHYVGATPVLVDSEVGGYNMSAEDAERRFGSAVKAVILPSMFGEPADPRPFLALGMLVIEDLAQSFGAGQPALGRLGQLAVCSFYATKVLTTVEGGMVLTDRDDWGHCCRDLRSTAGHEEFRLRYNYKMSNLNAAVGSVQLRRLSDFLARRRTIAQLYREAWRDCELILPAESEGHIYYRFMVRVPGDRRDVFAAGLRGRGVTCGRGVLNPLHRMLGLADRDFPAATQAFKEGVSIPIYPSLSETDVGKIIADVKDVIRNIY